MPSRRTAFLVLAAALLAGGVAALVATGAAPAAGPQIGASDGRRALRGRQRGPLPPQAMRTFERYLYRPVDPYEVQREFYFTRLAYSGHMYRGFAGSWSIDYPKADRQFMIGLKRLLDQLDAYDYDHALPATDPGLFRFPFLYSVEVGYMALSPAEREALRRYLLAGGFWVIDDFWGSWEWANLERELSLLLPEYPIVELPLDHPIFHCFYDVEEILQVPNVGQGRYGGPTWEQDGFTPHVRGIFDEDGRLMVVINWNTDLGDAWEWAEDEWYPVRFSHYAYQMGVNFVVYAMSH
ncbi:MAG: DUF4159 domain-containing protein [Acidobacteria bacterium]|nr:DUF4159 domain-containing protein [Acidobacteriota bacterium]